MRILVYIRLIWIITLRFTCGERKICSTIKKFQIIMNMIEAAAIRLILIMICFFFLKKRLSTWFICNSFMIKLQIISSKNSARYLFCSKKGYKTMTKCFIMKKKGNIFIKQLLSNCKATSTSDFHNDMSKCQGWGSILVPYKKV